MRPTTLEDLQVTILADATAPRHVRALITAKLSNSGWQHISDDAELIASELITNAADETPGRPIDFRLRIDADEVLLAVRDCSDRPPTPRPVHELSPAGPGPAHRAEEPDDRGRGLIIVAALVTDFGYEPDGAGGKWVWARLAR